jgi:uncharacterized protein (DUF58 family)
VLDRAALYDPDLIARLSGPELRGPPSPYPHRGVHRSRHRGASLEFSEHTDYVPGDDLRHLDWKVLGKTDRLFVKRYEDERVQRVVLLVDASGSMRYGAVDGGGVGSKYHLAARLAVALAACLLRQGDAVGVRLTPASAGTALPPRSGGGQLDSVIEVLGSCRPDGEAGLSAMCRAVGESLGGAAAVFVLSDLLDEGDEELAGLRWLRARGVAARIVQVLHADEVSLPFENTSRFVDLEGGGSQVLDPVPLRRAYREEIRGFVRGVARSAAALGVPHALCTSAEDPAPALGGMLRQMGRF